MDTALVRRLEQAVPDVFAGTPVVFAYLFGSRARGDARPNSDVDVAVYGGGDYPDPQLDVALLGFASSFVRAAGLQAECRRPRRCAAVPDRFRSP